MVYIAETERVDELKREGLQIIQSREVFSFSLDAVLLAFFADIAHTRPATIVDLCAGNGAVTLMLSAKTKNKVVGVELQEVLYDMAMRSRTLNQLEKKVDFLQADVRKLVPQYMKQESVDYITCNPPYFKVNEHSLQNKSDAYRLARHEVALPLEELLKNITLLLKSKGKAYLVHRPERLSDILSVAQQYHLEAKRVQFVYPKSHKNSNIVLIELMKDGGSAGVKIIPPIVVFDENGNYTEQMREILYG